MKCYSFYDGSCPLILRIRREDGLKKYCWYGADGKLLDPLSVDPKKGKNRSIIYFKGGQISDKIFDLQKTITSSTPSPFLRIDFLEGDDDIYLGEITPNPGRYSDQMTSSIDKSLGFYFEKSFSKLFYDLLNKKDFSHYLNTYS